jgi:hypothetical protein
MPMQLRTSTVFGAILFLLLSQTSSVPGPPTVDVNIVNPVPMPIEGTVQVSNETLPVNVSSTEDSPVWVRDVNAPGVTPFSASDTMCADVPTAFDRLTLGFKILTETNDPRFDNVPSGKVAVVEYISCRLTARDRGDTVGYSPILDVWDEDGAGTGWAVYTLAMEEVSGMPGTYAHVSQPFKMYAGPGDEIQIWYDADGPYCITCDASGHFVTYR